MEAYRGNTAQLKRALGRMRDPKSIFADKDKIKQYVADPPTSAPVN